LAATRKTIDIRITVTEDEYELLLKAKGSKTWKQWLLDIAMEQAGEDIAIMEVNQIFKVLREKLESYVKHSDLVGVVDGMRVVCIMLLRLRGDEERLSLAIDVLKNALDEARLSLRNLLKA